MVIGKRTNTQGTIAMVSVHDRSCPCGSGLERDELYDARGIFCCYTCDRCHKRQSDKYRADIFTDANYWHDEPIDEED
jgi:hypothetical protein